MMNLSFSTSESAATRTGKVARLPKVIRDRLNQQLRDNVPGKELVRWLNALPEVRHLVAEQFHGRVITPQNLSEWRQGGYQDWLAHEERRDWARRLDDEAQDLHSDSITQPLMENIASMFEVVLGQAVMRFLDKPVESAEDLKPLMGLSREIAKHRRLAVATAKARQDKLNHPGEDQTPHGMMTRARQKAYRQMMNGLAMSTQEDALFGTLPPADKKYVEDDLNRRMREYLKEKDRPGFALPLDEVRRELDQALHTQETEEDEDEDGEDGEEEGEDADEEGEDREEEGDPSESDQIVEEEPEDAERGDTETRRDGDGSGGMMESGDDEHGPSEVAEPHLQVHACGTPTSEGDPSGSDLIGVAKEGGCAEVLSATEEARRKRLALDLLKI